VELTTGRVVHGGSTAQDGRTTRNWKLGTFFFNPSVASRCGRPRRAHRAEAMHARGTGIGQPLVAECPRSLGDVLFADKFRIARRTSLPSADDLRAQVLRELKVGLQGTLGARDRRRGRYDIDDEQFTISRLRHASRTRHQILRRWIELTPTAMRSRTCNSRLDRFPSGCTVPGCGRRLAPPCAEQSRARAIRCWGEKKLPSARSTAPADKHRRGACAWPAPPGSRRKGQSRRPASAPSPERFRVPRCR